MAGPLSIQEVAMPKMTGGVKTGRFYVSLSEAGAEEIDGYIRESGMYRACFLSYALAVGTRVVERQRTHPDGKPHPQSKGPVPINSEDFSSAAHHERVVARQKLVDLAMAQMAPEQRALMQLAYFDGLTESELAERLALPVASIRARMVLALQHLDALLSQEQSSSA
jgi:hypothetical protein